MIKTRSDTILLTMLFLVVCFLFYFRMTPENTKETYGLESEQVIYYEKKAIKCDSEAIQGLIAHYAVHGNKEKFDTWRNKEKSCREQEQRGAKGSGDNDNSSPSSRSQPTLK